MSLHSAAYDKPGAEPALLIAAEGAFDVGRLIDILMNGNARCEHAHLAARALRQVRRHNKGRSALRLLRHFGGPDLLQPVPGDEPMRKALRLAICDPGAVLPRAWEWRDGVKGGDRHYEPLTEWQTRAVVATIVPWLAESGTDA